MIGNNIFLTGGGLSKRRADTLYEPVTGRDLSADGDKLDGIEAGATADQTDAEILAAVESESGRDMSADGDKLDVLQPVLTQAINMTAATSGSNGIQIANNADINFGTGDFSLVWVGSLPDWDIDYSMLFLYITTTESTGIRLFIENGVFGMWLRYDVSGLCTYNFTKTHVFRQNSTNMITLSFYKDSTWKVALYINDDLVETINTGISDTEIIATADREIILNGNSTSRYNSISSAFYAYNRYISLDDAKDLYANGVAVEDMGGTNVLSSNSKWREVAPTLGVETRIYSMAVFNNKLYGGTYPNGKLHEWNGTDAWVEVAPKLDSEAQIRSMAVFNNKLYGGTYPNGKLYEWNGTDAWVEVAPKLGSETQIFSLDVFNNKLYGGTYPNGKLHEWNGTDAWVEVAPKLGVETRIYSLAVYNDKLYGGTDPSGKLYEWNGTDAWVEVAPKLGSEEQIFSLAVFNDKLYGGTGPSGKLYEWNGTDAWVEVAPKLGSETHILFLAVYKDKLYGGTDPNGKLYEWNEVDAWVEVAPKLGSETHIRSLAVYNDKLYGGTDPNGKLYGAGLGCTFALEPESIQPAPGQWLDSSGNGHHAKMPAEGCTLMRPQRDGIIEWTNTWAASSAGQYIGGINEDILPEEDIRIEWIRLETETTGVDVTIGDQTDTDRFVEATALSNELDVSSPAHRNHDGTNRKLVITPSGTYTGSVKTTIKYTIV